MIHGVYGTNVNGYLSLEENRINTSVAKSKIRYLVKLTNDMSSNTKYIYPTKVEHNDRYVRLQFTHSTVDNINDGRTNFKPFGFWSYEVYEVSWVGTVSITDSTAPSDESEVLSPSADTKGVVQGLVHTGKIYISETVGQEQIKYTTHIQSSSTNYIYTD